MLVIKYHPLLGAVYYCEKISLTRYERRNERRNKREFDPKELKNKSNSKFIK